MYSGILLCAAGYSGWAVNSMTKRVSVAEARANLADLLGTVYYAKEPVIVEKKGKPVAVLISPEQFEQWEKSQRAGFFDLVRRIQDRNEGEDQESGMRDVTAQVEEIRREWFERERHGT
jgi:prevent-host-death family protein